MGVEEDNHIRCKDSVGKGLELTHRASVPAVISVLYSDDGE